ncbi:unnamed protein product [Orchesella dallaii]|uniref:Arsenite methyltransferase n=1 Tax=Orchesella dallaii TaxID=48710 RepID=A0ABP1PT58_9HEXA
MEEVQVKEAVRKAYAEVAEQNSKGQDCGNVKSCCGAPKQTDIEYNKELGYSEEEVKEVIDGANMGLGCGNPTALAALKPGEIVVDLGSGGGFDCFLAAKRVGPTGHVIGIDMTPEMISKARINAKKGKYDNTEFRLGEIEHLPVADNSVDVIISNCVVNLSTDKPQVLRECGRILKKGGRVAISDIVATSELPESIKKDLELYSGCMAGATPIDQFREGLQAAGFVDIKIDVKEATRNFIKKWSYDSGAEQYVASANIEAIKG